MIRQSDARSHSPVVNLLELGVERPSDWRVFVAVAAAAVMTDLAVRSEIAVVAGTVLVVVVAAGLLAGGRWPTPRPSG